MWFRKKGIRFEFWIQNDDGWIQNFERRIGTALFLVIAILQSQKAKPTQKASVAQPSQKVKRSENQPNTQRHSRQTRAAKTLNTTRES